MLTVLALQGAAVAVLFIMSRTLSYTLQQKNIAKYSLVVDYFFLFYFSIF